jgi:hypothetical protein
MRTFREIFEMRETWGMHPCTVRVCQSFGKVISKSVGGVVCQAHLDASQPKVNERSSQALYR